MKNKGAKQKTKRKGAKEGAFGCDLTEYLQNTGQDVPQVLKSCAGFIEKNGIVDGVYRLSGITSNIQKLRQEFGTEQSPDLTKEVYLQDIHCVGSLCKQYFRELPNPLLTYELYKKFTEAVSAQSEEEQILRIHNVIKELPSPHYRTLEYLTKHLTHIASFSCETNMHSRNLALVWAPNLLRSKEIEGSGYNNDAAFLEVRVQSVVIEFILNHVNQLFNNNANQPGQENEAHNSISKCKSLPLVSPSMKLLTLEEAQARSLSPNHPARLEKWHCAPMDTGPAAGTIYHTVIDLPDPRRKLSAKAKKWKSIFNLGRSGADSKGKLSRNSSVFIRGRKLSEKASIRPAKSMDSLCSLPAEDDKHAATLGGGLSPAMKSHTIGSGGSYLGRRHSDWDQEDILGAIGGCASNASKETVAKEMLPLKPQPEPLKVIRGDALNKSEPTSPKTRRLFYSTNLNEASMKSNFPGNLFPLEASPRHHRKPIAVNISEPFSVSVPLHISGIISPGTTPCKEPQKNGPDLSNSSPQDNSSTVSQYESNNLPPAKHEKVTREPLNQPFPNPFSSRAEMKDNQNIEKRELRESQTIAISSKSFNLPMPFPNVTIQPSERLQSASSSSTDSSSNLPDREKQEESHALPSPLTESPCENCNHKTVSEGSKTDQTATKQDQEVNESSAKAFMEQLWPDIKEELKITEPETVTIASVQEKGEKSLLPSYDKNEIKEKSLPHASPDLPCTEPQKKHSSNQFLQSPCLSAMTETNKDTCPTCTHHILLTEESNVSDQTLSQPQHSQPMRVLLDISSETEQAQSTADKNILIENPSIMYAKPSTANSISNDSECNLGQPTDSGLIERDQRPAPFHEVQTSELRIRDGISKNTELSPKSNVNLSGMYAGDVFYIQTKPATVNLLNIKKNQKEQLPDRPSNLKSLASQTDSIELLTPEHWIDNDTFQKSSSHSSQRTKDEEECLTEVPEKVYGFSQIVTNISQEKDWPDPPPQILFFDDCTDKILPEDSYSSSYQSVNEDIGWSEQCLEVPSRVFKSEPSRSTCPVIKLVTFPNEAEEATSSELNVPLNKHNSVSSKESQSMNTGSTGAATCLVSVGTELIVKNSDGIKEYCLKCEDKPLSLHSDPTKTDKHPVPHGGFVQSIPIGVTAVRTTYMIRTCQVKAVPVIPPKVQFTQVPQPLQKKYAAAPFLPLDKVLTALQPSIVYESTCPESKNGPETCHPSLPITETKEGKENDLPISTKSKVSGHQTHIVPPDPTVSQSKTTQEAPVVRRACKTNGEDVMGSPTSSKAERSPALQKHAFLRHTQHRTRPGRPQSLILFSSPWPNMERTSSVESNKVLLSPIRSSTDQLHQLGLDCSTSGGCSNELNENQKAPEGVTLRSKMSIPKNGQRLETSTSCFYQPQRRSMIFENRGGRQIE
uniref:Cdc42 GTPase-activating protein n=1 Tax=Callorhinchus milii TaxID=7868 RepID=V9K7W7_CALMI